LGSVVHYLGVDINGSVLEVDPDPVPEPMIGRRASAVRPAVTLNPDFERPMGSWQGREGVRIRGSVGPSGAKAGIAWLGSVGLC
jgi:hypothetical protein